VGRTDLPGGSFLELKRSLDKLKTALPTNTTILSGHGDATTLERELKFNPYLRGEEDF
jgi:glyoxylase-like metal-dependent hydrolase (beta-lactamase superfamily II)